MCEQNGAPDSSLTRRSAVSLAWRGLTLAGLTGTIGNLAVVRAFGAVAGQRSLVCIDLIGGNDSNNLIVPLDADPYGAYSRSRGPLAIPKETLLPVQSVLQGGLFGFHPSMPAVQSLYNRGALAVLANTGPLSRITTKAEVLARSAPLPDGLLSHTGGDRLAYAFPGAAMPPWAFEYQEKDPKNPSPQVFEFGAVSMMSPELVKLEVPAIQGAVDAVKPLQTQFPDTLLGRQLSRVARILKAAPSLGVRGPIFTVTLPGFDTHRDLLARQAPLLAILSDAMSAFYQATEELGLAQDVTTFTHTEFNRTLLPNAKLGTEHAWGGHQLVMGGGVRGGEIHGKFPSLEINGADDAGGGILIPSTASVQYHDALGRWYGVPRRELFRLLPEIRAFEQAELQLLN